jgi:cysteine sulfinate desulfinase/cysteine desulfurase-like protein
MGFSPDEAAAAVRFSFSPGTTEAELRDCLCRLPLVVDRCLPAARSKPGV